MQTIRILNVHTKEMHTFTGIANRVETEDMRNQFPEGKHFIWLR